MNPELERRIYNRVLSAVLSDTDRSEILELLTVNGITGAPADDMIHRARNERIAMLRSDGIRKAVKGALLFAAGSALFFVFWFGSGMITVRLTAICGLLGLWGFWRLLSGTLDTIFASAKKGTVMSESD